jgi:putative GTP pyrophosphokinase
MQVNDLENDIDRDYQRVTMELQQWGAEVDRLLMSDVLKEMADDSFVKIPPTYRLKERKSYLAKVLYRQWEYKNPLVEITDKVATRIVMLKSTDVLKAAELILQSKRWESKVSKTIRDPIENQPNSFDYQSFHIIVSPDEAYASTIDKNILTCEIQIRTLLQHAFAEISHDSTYKGPYRSDTDILRHLAKSMALMEATDDYFVRVFDLMGDEHRTIRLLLKQLTSTITKYVPVFDPKQMDFDLNDQLMTLYSLQPMGPQDFNIFLEKNDVAIKGALQPDNGLMFQQPAILLAAFYLHHDKQFLKDHWPLNKKALESLFLAFNISFDNY